MAKNPFGDITAKKKATKKFIEDAKVDGEIESNVQNRRGASYKDPKTGEKIKLGGKILQVPLNEQELKTLTESAQEEGLPLATFLRKIAIRHAKSK
ncbi:hypothetical protein [Psychromonas aquatilis]|uniref:Ribbon-helix-helix CopG family protein n=1 Tax=Psychromonas aquatilis TaxID=2005072 RepID=A0ABU9GU19_9GAMM